MTGSLLGRYHAADLSPLEAEAARWLDGFYQLEHLFSAREWAIRLSLGTASPALKFAAFVHDAERLFPGGPSGTPQNGFDDAEYLFAHSLRSANIVADWLAARPEPVDPTFAARVRALILRHEIGGDPEEDLLQAADSLAWFSTFDWLVVDWVRKGHYDIAGARQKLDWMLTRIRATGALALALPLYTRAVAALEEPDRMRVDPVERRRQASDLALLSAPPR